ncbi:MAG: DUF983 domain-containing protein [bacterium]|nr:DUF983 domain-containing protein [bacterium]
MTGAGRGSYPIRSDHQFGGCVPASPNLRLSVALLRGVRQRCPRCGRGRLFRRWFTLHDHCPACGLRFELSGGDTWGFWIIGDRVFIAAIIILLVLGCLPQGLMGRVLFGALTLFALIWTMPHRQGICTALDYYTRVRWRDLAEPDPSSNAPTDRGSALAGPSDGPEQSGAAQDA